jgi:hypothetical protein
VDRTKEHLALYFGSGSRIVARIAPPIGKNFIVEFIRLGRFSDRMRKTIEREIRRELNFYLIELGEPDPWKYAKYHCHTASNLYGRIQWAFHPSKRPAGG